MNLQSIIATMKDSNHILISAHTNPDGDAIGAMVGLGHFCKALNIPYAILLAEPLTYMPELLEGVNVTYSVDEPVDTFVALDCGNTARLVGYDDYFKDAKQTIIIDHHMTNDCYAMSNYVVKTASSTSELIFDLIQTAQMQLTIPMARALYTGLVTDTGGFMHSCTGSSTHLAAAKLIGTGFDFSELYHKLIHEKSFETIALQAKATEHLQKISELGIYLSYLTKEDMEKAQATKDDVASIVSFLKNIKGVQVIGLLYPTAHEGEYKLSTRSNEPYDVAMFCSQFGGGGHQRAAGATLTGTLEQVTKQVYEALQDLQ